MTMNRFFTGNLRSSRSSDVFLEWLRLLWMLIRLLVTVWLSYEEVKGANIIGRKIRAAAIGEKRLLKLRAGEDLVCLVPRRLK